MCVKSGKVLCSRYVKGHMLSEHYEHPSGDFADHCVALSLSDLSFWCYACDSYITSPALQKLRVKFASVKFAGVDNVNNNADNSNPK